MRYLLTPARVCDPRGSPWAAPRARRGLNKAALARAPRLGLLRAAAHAPRPANLLTHVLRRRPGAPRRCQWGSAARAGAPGHFLPRGACGGEALPAAPSPAAAATGPPPLPPQPAERQDGGGGGRRRGGRGGAGLGGGRAASALRLLLGLRDEGAAAAARLGYREVRAHLPRGGRGGPPGPAAPPRPQGRGLPAGSPSGSAPGEERGAAGGRRLGAAGSGRGASPPGAGPVAGAAAEKGSPEQRPGSHSRPAARRFPGAWEALGCCPRDLISGAEGARPAGLRLGRGTSASGIARRGGGGTALAGSPRFQRGTVRQAARGNGWLTWPVSSGAESWWGAASF